MGIFAPDGNGLANPQGYSLHKWVRLLGCDCCPDASVELDESVRSLDMDDLLGTRVDSSSERGQGGKCIDADDFVKMQNPPGQILSSVIAGESHASKKQRHLDLILLLCQGVHLNISHADFGLSSAHCQLSDDLSLIMFAAWGGNTFAFPFTQVMKISRYTRPQQPKEQSNSPQQHVITLDFKQQTFAFLFVCGSDAQFFMTCLEELTKRAKRKSRRRLSRKKCRQDKTVHKENVH